jgi:CrcB protein
MEYVPTMNTLWVGLGGALGSIARYHVGRIATSRAPSFPWGTLAVNLLGCLLISVLMQLVLRGRLQESMRIALGVGLLGGFTTYSSFNFETLALAEAGAWGRAALYVGATVVGGIALGVVGWLVGRAVSP